MRSVIITLHSPSHRGTLDLELPAEVPVQNLLPALVGALQLPTSDGRGWPIGYQLVYEAQKRALYDREMLMDAGVVTGDVLTLTSSAAPMPGVSTAASAAHPGPSVVLRCASGAVIALDNFGKTELVLGRFDTRRGHAPDIDLSEEPGGETVSRSHALLRRQGGQWTLEAVSTKNVTQVGGTSLVPGQSCPLKSRDVIKLGAVELMFEVGRAS
jgi:uncharacterized ubiquitin-like protein YukD